MQVRFVGQDGEGLYGSVAGRHLCDYQHAIEAMNTLTARSPDAADLLLCVEHPPTITLGRRGGRASIHDTTLQVNEQSHPVAVYEVARGGAVTYHAPGQLVIYPIVQLPLLEPPIGVGPLGDLGGYVRALERCIVQCCAHFDLPTITREGFSGVWINERIKLASIGVGVRRGWTFHGLSLNINPHLEGFDLITPCALDGVRMTTMWQQLEELGRARPSYADVESDLLTRLSEALVRA
ncbi:MAG TPA: lipoyl(octanoyl) transferase [Myxococcales bacterium]|nr:lipoyl(octanoyl) transferase [Myxococcales bacterium]